MLHIIKVKLADAATLLTFSRKTFFEFFAHLNSEANMQAYASVAFTPQKIHAELSDPDSQFYFAMLGDELVGYLKLNFNNTQNEFKDTNALEVERIYVSGEHHGKKIGKQLLQFAIDMATQNQFEYLWLGVWEHNQKALEFYTRNGFELVGSHDFYLGDDKQVDLLMKRYL